MVSVVLMNLIRWTLRIKSPFMRPCNSRLSQSRRQVFMRRLMQERVSWQQLIQSLVVTISPSLSKIISTYLHLSCLDLTYSLLFVMRLMIMLMLIWASLSSICTGWRRGLLLPNMIPKVSSFLYPLPRSLNLCLLTKLRNFFESTTGNSGKETKQWKTHPTGSQSGNLNLW